MLPIELAPGLVAFTSVPPIAKALGGAFPNAQALHEHHQALRQKSQELEELELLQSTQHQNIGQLMEMFPEYSGPESGTTLNDVNESSNDPFFDLDMNNDFENGGGVFGGNGADGVFGNGADNIYGDDANGNVDLDELLREVHDESGHGKGVLAMGGTLVNATSPGASSVGSKPREDIEDIEEVHPKRRRMN